MCSRSDSKNFTVCHLEHLGSSWDAHGLDDGNWAIIYSAYCEFIFHLLYLYGTSPILRRHQWGFMCECLHHPSPIIADHFEDGLKGSWHPGAVLGFSSCSQILLCPLPSKVWKCSGTSLFFSLFILHGMPTLQWYKTHSIFPFPFFPPLMSNR